MTSDCGKSCSDRCRVHSSLSRLEADEASAPHRLESSYVVSPPPGMAGLRRLFHGPTLLADGSSACSCMAGQRTFPFSSAGAGLDRYVGRHRGIDGSMAIGGAVHDRVGLGSFDLAVCDGNL